MSDNSRHRAGTCLLVGLLLAGCGGAKKPCQQCEEPPGDAFHMHHTTFAFHFAPPWFNADQRSLFTSYVVFPVETKFAEWIGHPSGERCNGATTASLCPDTEFYGEAMVPFLNGLSQCATTEPVQLHLVGFASSTRLKQQLTDERKTKLEKLHKAHITEITGTRGGCRGKRVEKEMGDHSDMFNLLIANERAVNTATMLRGLVRAELESAFDIKAIPWCSQARMEKGRRHNDDSDPAKGLMNRRVEVRLALLPGCVNVDPDSRIDVTAPSAAKVQATSPWGCTAATRNRDLVDSVAAAS